MYCFPGSPASASLAHLLQLPWLNRFSCHGSPASTLLLFSPHLWSATVQLLL
ncbi:hypothetical protein PtB15_2B728 [Puccinia triticina]|nr:hypothetical protein PtB15_2B728 [Puccinia triticina]